MHTPIQKEYGSHSNTPYSLLFQTIEGGGGTVVFLKINN